MKTNSISTTDLRTRLSDVYHSVQRTGKPMVVTNHGDAGVVMLRVSDVYPEPATEQLFTIADHSGAFSDLSESVDYE